MESSHSSGDTSLSQTPCSSPQNCHHHSAHVDSSCDEISTSANSTLTRQKASAMSVPSVRSFHRFTSSMKVRSTKLECFSDRKNMGSMIHGLSSSRRPRQTLESASLVATRLAYSCMLSRRTLLRLAETG